MQDKKLINFGGATVGEKGVYSIEFHEDNEFTHVKRANRDGTATYFSLATGSGSGGRTIHPFEFWKNDGPASTALDGVAPGVAITFNGSVGTDLTNSPSWINGNLFNGISINTSELQVGEVINIRMQLAITPSASNATGIIHTSFDTDNGPVSEVVWRGDTGHQGNAVSVNVVHTITVLDQTMISSSIVPNFTFRMEGADADVIPVFLVATIM